jgi:hypothetical protein
MFKMLLRLHYSTDFDESWVEGSSDGGFFRVFRNFEKKVI